LAIAVLRPFKTIRFEMAREHGPKGRMVFEPFINSSLRLYRMSVTKFVAVAQRFVLSAEAGCGKQE
jgi:hypothetical protein